MPIADTGQSLFLIQEPIDTATLNDQDRQFISQANSANQAEIDEAKLATSHSDNTAVQIFGQWMIADHAGILYEQLASVHCIGRRILFTTVNLADCSGTLLALEQPSPSAIEPRGSRARTSSQFWLCSGAGSRHRHRTDGSMIWAGRADRPYAESRELASRRAAGGDCRTTEPTAAQQGEIAQLQSLSPSDFVTAYTDDQINDHVNTLMQFIQEASTGQDPVIKDFAQNTIPLLPIIWLGLAISSWTSLVLAQFRRNFS